MKQKKCPQRGPTMNAKRWWYEHNYDMRAARASMDQFGPAQTIVVESRLLNRRFPVRNANALMKHVYGDALDLFLRDVPFIREYARAPFEGSLYDMAAINK